MYIETEGIVLRSVKYKDSDTILTLFTKKMGKLTVYAKNVRKLNHTSMAVSQVFAYGNFMLRTQGKMMQLHSFDLKENFYYLTQKIDKTFLAYYLAELTEQVLIENQTNHRMLVTFLEILKALKMSEEYSLIKSYYEMKVLYFYGVKPEIAKCMKCGIGRDTSRRFFFHINDGGIYCENCLNDNSEQYLYERYDHTTYLLMDFMIAHSLEEVLEAKIAPILLKELVQFLERYYIIHMPDIHVKSAEFVRHLQ